MRLTITILCLLPFTIFGQSKIEGQVIDSTTLKPILFGTVALIQNDQIIKGIETDLEGHYFFEDVRPGIYDLEATYVGYIASRIRNISVGSDQTTKRNIAITEGQLSDEIIITRCGFPRMVIFDEMESGAKITSEDIRKMPIPK